jgi:hypothetical protein
VLVGGGFLVNVKKRVIDLPHSSMERDAQSKRLRSGWKRLILAAEAKITGEWLCFVPLLLIVMELVISREIWVRCADGDDHWNEVLWGAIPYSPPLSKVIELTGLRLYYACCVLLLVLAAASTITVSMINGLCLVRWTEGASRRISAWFIAALLSVCVFGVVIANTLLSTSSPHWFEHVLDVLTDRPSFDDVLLWLVVASFVVSLAVASLLVVDLRVQADLRRQTAQILRKSTILRTTLWMCSMTLVAGVLEVGSLYDWGMKAASYAYRNPGIATSPLKLAVPLAFGVLYSASIATIYVLPAVVLRRQALELAAAATGTQSMRVRQAWLSKQGIRDDTWGTVLRVAAIAAPALTGPIAEILKAVGGKS